MLCPNCKKQMEPIGSCGILDYEGRWEAEVARHRCKPCKYMVFISSDADMIDEAEEAAAEDGHHPLDMDNGRED